MSSYLPAPFNQPYFFQHLLSTSQTGVATLQPVREDPNQIVDFVFTYANDAAQRILRHSVQELTDKKTSYLRLFPLAKERGLFDACCRVVQTGQTYHTREMSYAGDGLDGWYDLQVTAYENILVLMIVDVTTLKRVQLDRERQAAFLNGLLQTSSSGVIVYEAIRSPADGGRRPAGDIIDFKTVYFNTAYEAILDESADSIRNRTFRQRLKSQSDAHLFDLYCGLINTGRPVQYEQHFPHLRKWLRIAGTRLQDSLLLMVDDISERKEAEATQKHQSDQLLQVNEELLRSNEKLQQFSYVASHDLQEPLRKIRQFGNILQSQYGAQLGEEGANMLTRMQAAAARMSTLIRDVLNYSRLGSQPQSFSRVDLNELVGGVMTALELAIAEKGAVVEVGKLGTVIGDATQLGQVIQNLLTNALKFTRPGQAPSIRIGSQQVAAADLPGGFRPASDHPQFCAINVSDDGIGFDPQHTERIFGAFERLHGKGEYAGTGIGLAITKRVAENHGGYIMAESQPGHGATFTLFLPA